MFEVFRVCVLKSAQFHKPGNRAPARRIDLASVRDTLLYIESDLTERPELARLADASTMLLPKSTGWN